MNSYNLDELIMRYGFGERPRFYFFYGGIFSNWYEAPFVDNLGMKFACTEQYMMYYKALTFLDYEIARQIMIETSPREHKKLGRQVRNFDQQRWRSVAFDIVYQGNLFKYSQNEQLKYELLSLYRDTIFVEASPSDEIWGIKKRGDDPDIYDPNNWKGLNLLGFVLTKVRDSLE